MIAAHVLGSWRTAGDVYARVGGQWRRATGMQIHSGGSWRNVPGFVPAFTASAPSEADGFGFGSASFRPASCTTDDVTIALSGGVSPYSYSWTRTSGDGRITASSPATATTQFRATLLNQTANAVFHWTATDASGAVASGDITVILTATSGDFA